MDREREMKESFGRTRSIILSMPERFDKEQGAVRVGLESEIAIHGEGLNPTDYESKRDRILAQADGFAGIELGANQIEIRTPPIDIQGDGLSELISCYKGYTGVIETLAKREGYSMVRMGSNPFLPVSRIVRTSVERYRLVPDYHDLRRRRDIGTKINGIDVGRADIVSLFQSFQVNWEASGIDDAIEKMNYSLMFGPYFLAMAANSRFLDGRDSRVADIRMIAWELSHDIRTPEQLTRGERLRVGLPECYFSGIEDYLGRTGRFPFILYDPEHAFQIGIGLHWLDTRVKFIGDSAVVEFRLLPTQSCVKDEIALLLLWIGRIILAQKRGERLLSIDRVRENRVSAMYYGLGGLAWHENGLFSMREVVKNELVLSLEGLVFSGFDRDTIIGLLHESPLLKRRGLADFLLNRESCLAEQ